MTVLLCVLIALLTLIFGFLIGITVEIKPKVAKKEIEFKREQAEIQKEYENFLNYDGSVQQ